MQGLDNICFTTENRRLGRHGDQKHDEQHPANKLQKLSEENTSSTRLGIPGISKHRVTCLCPTVTVTSLTCFLTQTSLSCGTEHDSHVIPCTGLQLTKLQTVQNYKCTTSRRDVFGGWGTLQRTGFSGQLNVWDDCGPYLPVSVRGWYSHVCSPVDMYVCNVWCQKRYWGQRMWEDGGCGWWMWGQVVKCDTRC